MSAGNPEDTALGRVAIQLAREGIVCLDGSRLVTCWNPAASEMLGWSPEEMVGRSMEHVVPTSRRPEVDEAFARAQSGTSAVDTLLIRRDGSSMAVALTVAPVSASDGDDRFVVLLRGTDDREQAADRAARRLAAIVESSDDAIVSKDLDGIVTSWNASAERIFGYSAAEMIGASIRTLIPEDRQAEEDATLARIRRGEKLDHFETIRRRKDGRLLPISLTVSPIRTEDGRIIGASKIARDITLLKQAEADRLRTIQEASRLKDLFLASLSHELRTPLNAILGYARMLNTGVVPEDRKAKAIETIERNASSLAQIVDDVLDISRIVSGKMRLNVQAVELGDLVEAAIDAVRLAADARGVTIELRLDKRSGPIAGDPERLQQVLWNLLSNAVKFTGRGGTVTVHLVPRDSLVEVAVVDSGVGIAAEFMPRVFERFSQAEGGTRGQGGLGLGLAISRELVEMHGGTIAVSSEGIGKGSTFRLTLPLKTSQAVYELVRGEEHA